MPPKFKFSKEDILNSALAIVKVHGFEYLSARTLAKELNSSSKVIFGQFNGMDDIKKGVVEESVKIYYGYLNKEFKVPNRPLYVSTTFGYIKFAKEEKNLFKLLFMRDRSKDELENEHLEAKKIIEKIQQASNLSYEQSKQFWFMMWIFMHGISSMLATNYLNFDDESILDLLNKEFKAIYTIVKGE